VRERERKAWGIVAGLERFAAPLGLLAKRRSREHLERGVARKAERVGKRNRFAECADRREERRIRDQLGGRARAEGPDVDRRTELRQQRSPALGQLVRS